MFVQSLRHELVVLYTRSRHEVMTCSRGLVTESLDNMLISVFDHDNLYSQFLTWAGLDGRPLLRSLKLRVAASNHRGTSGWNGLEVLLRLMLECSGLHTLYLYFDMDYVAAKSLGY
jgi:hypothetical protein